MFRLLLSRYLLQSTPRPAHHTSPRVELGGSSLQVGAVREEGGRPVGGGEESRAQISSKFITGLSSEPQHLYLQPSAWRTPGEVGGVTQQESARLLEKRLQDFSHQGRNEAGY